MQDVTAGLVKPCLQFVGFKSRPDMGIPCFSRAKPRVFEIDSRKEAALATRGYVEKDVSARRKTSHEVEETCLDVFEMFKNIDAINRVERTDNWQRMEVSDAEPQVRRMVLRKCQLEVTTDKMPGWESSRE